jgi:hypothetical protein
MDVISAGISPKGGRHRGDLGDILISLRQRVVNADDFCG